MTALQHVRTAILLAALAANAAAAQPQMSARELFYSPVPAAAAKPPSRPVKTAKAVRPPKPEPPPQETAGARRQPEPPAPPPPTETRPPEAGFVPVSHQTKSLALRYSVLKLAGDGRYEEVDPENVFRSGDRIRIAVQVNDAGYLYVVHQGSSGVWKVLFPSSEVDHGSNRVRPGQDYEIPPGGRFYFDEQAGVEKLFLVVSRRPVDDLDSLIYSVRPGATPVRDPGERQAAPVLMAGNFQPVDDGLISRIRAEVMARDLVFEKVDESKPGPGERREKAVYAAVVEGGDQARVVADIELRHQ